MCMLYCTTTAGIYRRMYLYKYILCRLIRMLPYDDMFQIIINLIYISFFITYKLQSHSPSIHIHQMPSNSYHIYACLVHTIYTGSLY